MKQPPKVGPELQLHKPTAVIEIQVSGDHSEINGFISKSLKKAMHVIFQYFLTK